jgi:gluconokinase
MMKRGWRDSASAGLEEQKKQAGLGDRDDIVVFFDLMDVEEGRAN